MSAVGGLKIDLAVKGLLPMDIRGAFLLQKCLVESGIDPAPNLGGLCRRTICGALISNVMVRYDGPIFRAMHCNKSFMSESSIVTRPWGTFECLVPSLENYQLKRLIVNPGQCTSLQKHKFRSEHWFVAAGVGEAIVGTNRIPLQRGVSVDIAQQQIHRLSCHSHSDVSLVVIETQLGDYLGEDDIVRFEDIYGRNE